MGERVGGLGRSAGQRGRVLTWVVVGIVATMVLVLLWRMGAKHRILLHPAHIEELARQVARIKPEAQVTSAEAIKAAASEHPDQLPPCTGVTSVGLTVVYTVRHLEGGKHRHHVILSRRGRYFATAIARFLAAALHELLGIGDSPFVLALSDQWRYHLIWTLPDDAAQEEYAARPVATPEGQEVEELIRRCLDRRRKITVVPLSRLEQTKG